MSASLSRRGALGLLTSLAGMIGFGGDAQAAQTKLSKVAAKYQNHPKGQQRCNICINFQPPNQCRFVVGPIARQGWCELFAARENAH
ncbi:MAG: hypothetical protein ACRED8_03425 [Caulobacteraceae bacterium]